MTYPERLEAYAKTLENGTVEVAVSRDGYVAQTTITGITTFELLPTFQVALDLFGAQKVALMCKPNFDGKWTVALVAFATR